jgi:hypothetical protein
MLGGRQLPNGLNNRAETRCAALQRQQKLVFSFADEALHLEVNLWRRDGTRKFSFPEYLVNQLMDVQRAVIGFGLAIRRGKAVWIRHPVTITRPIRREAEFRGILARRLIRFAGASSPSAPGGREEKSVQRDGVFPNDCQPIQSKGRPDTDAERISDVTGTSCAGPIT